MKKLITLFILLFSCSVLHANSSVLPLETELSEATNEITPLAVNVVLPQKKRPLIPKKLTRTIQNIRQLQLSYNLENRLGYLKFVFKF